MCHFIDNDNVCSEPDGVNEKGMIDRAINYPRFVWWDKNISYNLQKSPMERGGWIDDVDDGGMTLKSQQWLIGLNVQYELLQARDEICNMYPCKTMATLRLVETASLLCKYGCGAASGASVMLLCASCYQRHKEIVKKTIERGLHSIRYYFDINK